MTAPQSDPQAQPESAPEAEPGKPTEPEQTELPIEQEPAEEEDPLAVKEKLRKQNSENRNLRNRLKEYETAAQKAEREKMDIVDRERAEHQDTKTLLAQRDTQLLQARYHIPDDFIEFIGEGSFEEKEARAAKVGEMVRSKSEPQERPPTDRPVESLKPGASPSTPPREDHSYPAGWGFQPERA